MHAIMRPVLHVTNGDSAVGKLREAGMEGDLLPWRDALHEGPVRAGLDHADLRAERARFIAARGWAEETRRARGHDRARRAALPRGEEARAILACEHRWEARPERWLGGVHLPAGSDAYRYDAATGRFA